MSREAPRRCSTCAHCREVYEGLGLAFCEVQVRRAFPSGTVSDPMEVVLHACDSCLHDVWDADPDDGARCPSWEADGAVGT